MTINVYDKGDLVRLPANFKNAVGADTDPTGVTFAFTTPAGVITTYVYLTDAQLVKDSVGNYHVDLTVNEAGMYYYRWAGTGAVQAVEVGQFSVKPGGF